MEKKGKAPEVPPVDSAVAAEVVRLFTQPGQEVLLDANDNTKSKEAKLLLLVDSVNEFDFFGCLSMLWTLHHD